MTPRHLERVAWAPGPDVDVDAWPFTIPAVRQFVEDGNLEVPAGFFLRSETLHDYVRAMDTPTGLRAFDGERLAQRSHGEAVIALLRHRFNEPGVYFLDEPEAALSFTSTLGLLAVLGELAEAGCQVLSATHSPVLTALPGATLLEVGDWGIRESRWEELQLVCEWRLFLEHPATFLRHLLPGQV